jgi:hypothetical protein
MQDELRLAIIEEAKRIGANPHDFATTFSYETGGTFDPWQPGPTTQWGQHKGFIQMGEPQRKKYGYTEGKSIPELVRASADYLVDNGYKPGMGLLDMYSIINAGGPGKYNASDANNGGAPGTVADKVYGQMGGHKDKATALLGGTYVPPAPSSPLMTPSRQGVTNSSPVEGVDHSWLADFVPVKHESPQQEYFRNAYMNPDPPGYLGSLPTAFANDWSPNMIADHLASSGFDPDPNFDNIARQDALKQLTKGKVYPEEMLNSFGEAQSRAEMQAMASVFDKQLERERVLSSAGWSGLGASMTAAILDPIAIGASVLTEGALAPVIYAAKAGRLARIGEAALMGGVSNIAAEAAIDAVDNRSRSVSDYALAFGAGAALLGAFKTWSTSGSSLGPRLTETANRMINPRVPNQSTAGAAQVGYATFDNLGSIGSLTDADVPQAAMVNARLDNAAWTGRHHPTARFLGRTLMEDPLGRDAAGNVLNTADVTSVEKAMMYHREVNNLRRSLVTPYTEWAKENGMMALGMFKTNKSWLAFGDYLGGFEPGTPGYANLASQPAYVRKAVSELDKFYSRWDAHIKNPGEELGKTYRPLPWGSRSNYRPMMVDHDAVLRMIETHGRDKLQRAIAYAMQDVLENLDERLANKFARGYMENLIKSGYGNVDQLNHALAGRDRGELLRFITEELQWDKSDEDVDALIGKIMQKNKDDETSGNPARGKHRTAINYNFVASWVEPNGDEVSIPIRDLFSRNQIQMAERYADQVSGHIALARLVAKDPRTGETMINGITTRSEWNALIRETHEAMIRDGVKPAEADETIRRLEYVYDHITGKPRLGAAANTAWAATMRRVSGTMFVRLMQNMGLYQFQEIAHIPAAVGFHAMFKAIPSMRLVMTAKGAERKALIPELMALQGLGDDSILNFTKGHFLEEAFGETRGNAAGRMFDNALAVGKRMTNKISLFNVANSMSHQMAMTTIAQRFGLLAMKHKDKLIAKQTPRMKAVTKSKVVNGKVVQETTEVPVLDDLGKPVFDTTYDFKVDDINSWFGRKDADRMRMMGFDDKSLAEVLKNIYQNAEFTQGGRLVYMNFEKWDPVARARFARALYSWTGRVIQRNDVGSLAKWMTTPLAGMIFQFRSFVMGAWGKQTLHNIANFDPRAMAVLMSQVGAGTMMYYLQGKARSLGKEDPDEYMDDTILKGNLTDTQAEALVLGGIGRTGASSILPMLVDTAMPWITGDSLFANSRSSTQASDLILGSPAVSTYNDVMATLTSVGDMVREGRTPSQPELRKMGRLLGVWLPFTIGLDKVIQDYPKYTPKDPK